MANWIIPGLVFVISSAAHYFSVRRFGIRGHLFVFGAPIAFGISAPVFYGMIKPSDGFVYYGIAVLAFYAVAAWIVCGVPAAIAAFILRRRDRVGPRSPS